MTKKKDVVVLKTNADVSNPPSWLAGAFSSKKEPTPDDKLEETLAQTLDESSKPENWVPMYRVGNGTSPSPLNPFQRPAYWQNDKAGLQSKTMPACCVGVYDEYGFRVKKP